MNKKSCFLIVLFLFMNSFHISCDSFEQIVEKTKKSDKQIVEHSDLNTNLVPAYLLHKAVEKDNISEVNRLLTEKGWQEAIASLPKDERPDPKYQKVNVNLKNGIGMTALFFVQSLKMTQLLISKGADVLTRNERQETPLHWVKKVAIANLLIEEGIDVNAKDENGNTPLHRVSDLDMAKFLVEKGADVLAKNEFEEIPLHEVTRVDIAKFFIEQGADKHAKNEFGNTPVSLAFYLGNAELTAFYACLDNQQPENSSRCIP